MTAYLAFQHQALVEVELAQSVINDQRTEGAASEDRHNVEQDILRRTRSVIIRTSSPTAVSNAQLHPSAKTGLCVP